MTCNCGCKGQKHSQFGSENIDVSIFSANLVNPGSIVSDRQFDIVVNVKTIANRPPSTSPIFVPLTLLVRGEPIVTEEIMHPVGKRDNSFEFRVKMPKPSEKTLIPNNGTVDIAVKSESEVAQAGSFDVDIDRGSQSPENDNGGEDKSENGSDEKNNGGLVENNLLLIGGGIIAAGAAVSITGD